jgi:hypothetical protein
MEGVLRNGKPGDVQQSMGYGAKEKMAPEVLRPMRSHRPSPWMSPSTMDDE